MSNPSLAGIENSISIKVEELKDSISNGKSSEEIEKIADQIKDKLTERNEKCKLLK